MYEKGSNIFELLSEDSNKKQKQQQKKENVPKADNKAKKEGAKAPVKAANTNNNNNNKAPQQSKGNGRGRGEGRGRGGRGRGPRAEGRNFPVDGEQQPRGNNNRGRQVSRRQRDESAKRGDYGAPDAEGRQKRPHDKFSHSAGARRKQEKKGGAGAGNWGTKGQVPEEAPVAEEEEKKEFEEAPVADEALENAEGEEEIAPEEEDNEIDYDTFVERKKKEEEELAKLIQTDVRKVDAADYKDLKTITKSGDTIQLVPLNGKKKGKKAAKADNNKGVSVDQVLDVRAPAQENNRRKGRQNNRNNQRSQKRDVKLALGDDKDFPSLGK